MLTFKPTEHTPKTYPFEDVLGLIPYFLDEADERSAKEQIHASYAYGGGWRSFNGFELKADNSIKHPGGPALRPIAYAKLRDEEIFIYPYARVLIRQPNGDFEIARID